ncbi:ATP-binding protein [Geomonas sp. Red32]|uniref:AAA family ATPase n=1 Tax=Geomonas sp. Red32 TaxID=2912856 RepID=UPI00202CBE18|nr:ATP-binding protein [Geomonas sp. Red32]MCM0080847.1 ATP-binding protein [Geomonas sp. Red32]
MSSQELLQETFSSTLYLVCGKAAAGKSTLAAQLASKAHTVLIEEDDWLARLYPGEISDLAGYVRCTGRVRDVLGGLIVGLLRQGMSVVLDFPANTPPHRQWAKNLSDEAGARHELHYLEVTNETCKKRLRERNASGSHPFTLSEEAFDQITRYFVPPSPGEGLNLVLHDD